MDLMTHALLRNRVRTATVADIEDLARVVSDVVGDAQLAALVQVATAEQKRRERARVGMSLTLLGV